MQKKCKSSAKVKTMQDGKKKIELILDDVGESHLMHFMTILPHIRNINKNQILCYHNVVNYITQRFSNQDSEWNDDSNILNLLPKSKRKRPKRSVTNSSVEKSTAVDDGKIHLYINCDLINYFNCK